MFWAAANLLISWFLALIINIIPGIVTWAIFIVWGHISESMKTRVELYNSLRETVKPIFYAASGWLSWDIIFANIFELYNHDNADESWASYTPRVRFLVLIVCSCLIAVQVFQVIEFIFFFVTVLSLQSMLSQMIGLCLPCSNASSLLIFNSFRLPQDCVQGPSDRARKSSQND